jgi:hypothetical protein
MTAMARAPMPDVRSGGEQLDRNQKINNRLQLGQSTHTTRIPRIVYNKAD